MLGAKPKKPKPKQPDEEEKSSPVRNFMLGPRSSSSRGYPISNTGLNQSISFSVLLK